MHKYISNSVWNKCAEETVPPKEVYYASDNKRVHVALRQAS